jgi:hypothetical protein
MIRLQRNNYPIPESKGISILERFFARDVSSLSSLHDKREHYCDLTSQ